MEVHHQSQSSSKKWTHYIWEFLMLFLAVFCGFLAENLREHNAEHIRAKEFAKSLVQDLQSDTTAINKHRRSAEVYIAVADTLLNLYKKPLEGRTATEFSFYTRFMYWTVHLIFNRATFDQIKNSGSLRYFKNYHLLDKMIKYDAAINGVEAEYVNHRERANMLPDQINSILDPFYHQQMSQYFLWTIDSMSEETREKLFSVKTPSLENKRELIKKMLNMIVIQQRNLRFDNVSLYPRIIELAVELMGDLRKEYHLE